MEMREKIKLKSKKRKLNNQKLNKTNEDNTKTTDFIYDKKISKEINEDDLEKYEKIIVNKKYIFINKIYIYFIYSPKKI
jgi:phage-related protein